MSAASTTIIYGPGSLILAIVGDIDAEQVRDLVETVDWRLAGPEPPVIDLPYTELQTRAAPRVDPDARQGQLRRRHRPRLASAPTQRGLYPGRSSPTAPSASRPSPRASG
jgi:hypothetical protein